MGQMIAGQLFTLNRNWSPELKVLKCKIYRGPHLYSATPMIQIQVDLGELEEWPTNKLPDFTNKLLEMLPGLHEHGCSSGVPGGFVERLNEGTWLGHVIEHIAIELQVMAGLNVGRGKTRSVKNRRGHYNIMYSYKYEKAGLCAGKIALDLVASILPQPLNNFIDSDKVYDFSFDNGFDLEAGLKELNYLIKEEKFGPTTQSLVEEAERRGIPWLRLDENSLVQLGTGKYQKIIRGSITSNTSSIAVETACDKDLTKKLLSGAGIPVPAGDMVRTLEGAIEAAKEIGFPVVIKPYNANHGKGVFTNLKSAEELAEVFAITKGYSKYILVEKFYSGHDYRVLVVSGEVVAVAERVPAHVTGNGRQTIAQLIAEVNKDPRRGDGHEEVMTRIKIDEALIKWLARSALTLESIPAKGQHVALAATANLSTGGSAVDRTDDIHPDNAFIVKNAALTIGLDVAGIDLILPDITKPWHETGGGIVEVNASPGFRMHLHPAQGQPRDVARPVIDSLFPATTPTHVPVIAVTGTNGKSTTVRMVAHILRQSGLKAGFTSTSGIFVNDECIWRGDASGPKSARILLRDPTIDVAVLETARGGLVREGLGVKQCDVGAVLNVTADHLGISGIDTLEDLAAVKSIVSESVCNNGISVLNADDPLTYKMAEYAGGNVCYFSMQPARSGLLYNHIEEGGLAITRETIGGKWQIVLHKEGARIPIIGIDEIPATHMGAASFNVENALAASAIATGLGISPQVIKAALGSFTSSYEQNPGRFNIYDGHGFRTIIDYAHNPAGLTAFFKTVRQMRGSYMRVIGHISTPGDRRDEDIKEVGCIAANELDVVIFREAPDNRGRPDGEVLRLLKEGALSTGISEDKIICIHGEKEATDICLKLASPGDLVILTPSGIESCWKQMREFKPKLPLQDRNGSYQGAAQIYA